MSKAIGFRRRLLPNDATKTRALAHIRGEVRSEATKLANADPPDDPPDVIELAPSMSAKEIAHLCRERKRYLRGKRGKPPNEFAEILTWGPPRHVAADAWSREQSQEWAKDTLNFVKQTFIDSPVVAASLHMDEGSPHVHIALFPRHTDAVGVTAFGWKRAESAASARLAGVPPQLNDEPQRKRSISLAGEEMSLILDAYHAKVGEKHGLKRGVKGSKKKHKAVEIDKASRLYAADRAAVLDVRESKIDARAVRVEQGYRKHKADLHKRVATLEAKRDAIKRERDDLKKERARLAKLDAEIEDKNRISREFAASTVDERLALHAENQQLRSQLERARPFVSEGLARRKAEDAQRRADAAYQQRLDKLESDDAELEAILELEAQREEEAKQAEAERQLNAGEKVVSMTAFSRLRGRGGGKGKGRGK